MVQILVAGIPGLGLVAGGRSLVVGAIVALALTPVVTVAQNALEKAEKIPALFRHWDEGEPPTHATGPDLAPCRSGDRKMFWSRRSAPPGSGHQNVRMRTIW